MWRDLALAVRRLSKDRSLTVMAVAALSLGIGANATIFTFVNAVLIRGLPFEESDQLMHLATFETTEARTRPLSFPEFEDWQAQASTFSALAAFTGGTANLADNDHAPERIDGSRVTPNMFAMLRQPVLLGRDFVPEDGLAGADPVMLLGYAVWQNRYGGDPNIIGTAVRVNEEPTTIIGVMPEGMQFPSGADLWRPLGPSEARTRELRNVWGVGRIAPSVDRTQAQAELDAVAGQLALEYPDTNEDFEAVVQTFNEWQNGGEIRLIFLTMMGAVAFVLLIACANVANLLLARSARRAREVAVRVSLGASRWRVVRQLLLESVVLAVLAGAVGLVLAAVGIRLFDLAVADVGKPYWIQFTMDWRVFSFLGFVCLATSVVFGLAPALHLSKTNVNELLQEGGRSGTGGARVTRLSGAMVVVEVMLTVVLLAGAGLMIRSFLVQYQLDIGVDGDRILTARMVLPRETYPENQERIAFVDALTDRLQSMPGIVAASLTGSTPLRGGSTRELEFDGRPAPVDGPAPTTTVVNVGDNYFASLGLDLLRGRPLARADGTPGSEAVVVNRRFVAQFFEDVDPLGRRIRLLPNDEEPEPWMTIVGVSPNVRQNAVETSEPDAVMYRRHRIDPGTVYSVQVHAQGDPAGLIPQVREAVRSVDDDLPIYEVATVSDDLAEARWPFAIFGSMFGIFAVIALVLSAVGVYAVTAYSITQRTQEIGLRMALGAQPGNVIWMVMRRGFLQLTIGLSVGLVGAAGVGRVLEGLLIQVSPTDPATLVGIFLVLASVTTLACVGPARRASLLDPSVALRTD